MKLQIRSQEFIENLARGAWIIREIEFRPWNKELIFHSIYDVSRQDSVFRFVFRECEQVNYTIFGNSDDSDLMADVIGMNLGEDHHRQPAVITSDVFEVFITYGEFSIEKDW